jgi:hypothetical protein
MGHKRRRRRKSACEEAAAIVPAASPQTVTGPAAGNGWFTRFAVAFLIIFVLIWFLGPRDDHAGRA